MTDTPHILAVNPWIHDFAAYDVWSQPYGLLSLSAVLRQQGLHVSYVDCLDRFHPRSGPADPHARHGRGPYRKTPIHKPAGMADVNRTFSRYGIPPRWLHEDLERLPRAPDLILVTCIMTYWYPGAVETIQFLKSRFPGVPVLLGGIYARLCPEHARRRCGADEVVADDGQGVAALVRRHTGYGGLNAATPHDLDSLPFPAFDLQATLAYIPLLTTRGCPFGCAYCASRYLQPHFQRQSPERVLSEIDYWHRHHGVIDFAFYDDALLVDPQRHALPLLEGIVRKDLPVRFHTPNALHIRNISAEMAVLMKKAGFETLRLGLETTAFDTRGSLDAKVTETEFQRAVTFLRRAGFRADQIGAYLLWGLPGQREQAVRTSIGIVKATGITPILAYYTPIPHTPLWEQACRASRYDLKADPVFCNNAILPCLPEAFSWQALSRLKQLIHA